MATGYIKNLWQVMSPEKWSLDLFIHLIDEHRTCFNAFLIQHEINLDFSLEHFIGHHSDIQKISCINYQMMNGYKILKRK